MAFVHFWMGNKKLVISDDSDVLSYDFTKIIFLGGNLYLLDKLCFLWKGLIKDSVIILKRTNISATDITIFSSSLYYVNELGHVFQVSEDLLNPKEIVLYEESTSCAHGYTTSSHKVCVKYVVGNRSGLIYISDIGELWASGNYPQLGIESDIPKKVVFFEGRHITAADAGDDFHVIVSHKRDDICPVNNAINGETEIFLSNCPECTAEQQVLSPLSPYSDNCPLGLNLKKSSESLSASTSTSKNNACDKKSNDNTSSCTEEDSFHPFDGIESNSTIATDETKDDRASGSMLLINTEAARQFLTRQLSWVSTGGEELLAEVSVPTRIIRRNVSTVASLVYERVKNVGDKVATLSRHVSGGSENNSESFEEFEELNKSNASINSSFRWNWSYSEGSEEVLAERNGSCVTRGSRLIRGEVWSWGQSQYGQLGLGDIVRRHKPVLVGSVSHIGVVGVWCGEEHCLIHTLDGRVYGWGSNCEGQLLCNDEIKIQSSPVLCGRAILVAAGAKHSILLTKNGTFEWLSKKIGNLLEGSEDPIVYDKIIRLLSANNITCLVTRDNARGGTIASDLAHEQSFLEELLTVHNTIVKPLSRKSSLEETISNLCSRYTDILHVTAVVVAGLLEERPSYDVLGESRDELIYVYECYLNTICDVIAIAGFAHITRTVETPMKLTACFSDRLPTRKTSSESIITCAFSQPLSHIAVYKGMVSRGGGENEIIKWNKLLELQDTKKKEAELTKSFWESAGRITDLLRTPQRRIIKESRSSPLSLYNASRFSSHWFILLSDAFIHISSGSVQTFNIDTIWVDTNFDSDNLQLQNGFNVITPEETMTLIAANHAEKSDWFQAFQSSIKLLLNKQNVPVARTASYSFTKHHLYTNATYSGRWLNGKMEGTGKLEWPDGKIYTGQFRNNMCYGYGIIETPSVSTYEGQWRDGFKNGHGITKYDNGDIYIGYYKDGQENGHGVRKIGRFTSSQASVYVGEWLCGQKHGYGVMNNICTGEKYLGMWSNNMKNGSGLSVTLDGIYYEGQFVQDILTGHGVMVFEDGTYYEGELREAGVFSGKGTLTFSSGDTFEGSLHGTWADGVKISGTLHKNLPSSSPRRSFSKPSSFGQLCVAADQKWKSIFKQCWTSLGGNNEGKAIVGGECTQRAWEGVAVALGTTPRHASRIHELLHTIPQCGRHTLDLQQYKQVVQYLQQAFETTAHPLGRALAELVEAYTTTYGGVLVHPLLLPQAVAELQSITQRLYQVVTLLFPALPATRIDFGQHEEASMTALLHPIILPKIYSSLLVLYSLHNKTDNDTYWKRLLKWNRQPDSTLMPFLGVDKKFWMSEDGSQIKEGQFNNAITSLQQLKTTFSPMEKLLVIHSTFQEITKSVQKELGKEFIWVMDDLFPVFHYVVVRSHIQELGSEIHFIEDFIDPRLKHGEIDIMFTTLKACFFQILQEKISISN